jgi:hypothetical protein
MRLPTYSDIREVLPMIRWAFVLAVLALLTPDANAQRKRPPNYTLVEKGLYLGGWLEKPPEGVTAVLNVAERKDIYRTEHYLWKPIDDAKNAATLDFLQETVEFIDAQRKAGRATFVHCHEGVSRGPLVMAAYLMYSKKMTRNEALAYIRAGRPFIRPNPSFMDLLLYWEHKLKKMAI